MGTAALNVKIFLRSADYMAFIFLVLPCSTTVQLYYSSLFVLLCKFSLTCFIRLNERSCIDIKRGILFKRAKYFHSSDDKKYSITTLKLLDFMIFSQDDSLRGGGGIPLIFFQQN